MRCTKPGCECGGELFLSARCHHEGTEVSYVDGVLRFRCHVCGKGFASVAVQDMPHSSPYVTVQ